MRVSVMAFFGLIGLALVPLTAVAFPSDQVGHKPVPTRITSRLPKGAALASIGSENTATGTGRGFRGTARETNYD
jgi:hypothetical protein